MSETENQVSVEPASEEKTESKEVKATKRATEVSIENFRWNSHWNYQQRWADSIDYRRAFIHSLCTCSTHSLVTSQILQAFLPKNVEEFHFIWLLLSNFDDTFNCSGVCGAWAVARRANSSKLGWVQRATPHLTTMPLFRWYKIWNPTIIISCTLQKDTHFPPKNFSIIESSSSLGENEENFLGIFPFPSISRSVSLIEPTSWRV